jgi:hypothetical protein
VKTMKKYMKHGIANRLEDEYITRDIKEEGG